MFANPLCTCATLAVFIVLAVAAPSLSVTTSGQPAISNVDRFIVKTTTTNTGDDTLILLNHPESPLSKLPANTFKITDATGAKPDFTGIQVKYVLPAAIAAGEDAVTVLAPGQSVEVEHDLSEAYAFSKEGEYVIVPNNRFYFVNPQKKAVLIYASIKAHSAKVTSKLAAKRPVQVKRALYNNCTSSQQTFIATAASDAKTYALESLLYLFLRNATTPRFVTWFGTYDAKRHDTVATHFLFINENDFSSYGYDCTCTDPGTHAYTYRNEFGIVYLCGAFWKAPAIGTDSKAGTIIHEASHFTINGGTDDHVYGQPAAQLLAILDPDLAVTNADSHEYFAENNPALD